MFGYYDHEKEIRIYKNQFLQRYNKRKTRSFVILSKYRITFAFYENLYSFLYFLKTYPNAP